MEAKQNKNNPTGRIRKIPALNPLHSAFAREGRGHPRLPTPALPREVTRERPTRRPGNPACRGLQKAGTTFGAARGPPMVGSRGGGRVVPTQPDVTVLAPPLCQRSRSRGPGGTAAGRNGQGAGACRGQVAEEALGTVSEGSAIPGCSKPLGHRNCHAMLSGGALGARGAATVPLVLISGEMRVGCVCGSGTGC